MKKIQKFLASMLALLLILQVSPMGSLFAQETNDEEIIEVEKTEEDTIEENFNEIEEDVHEDASDDEEEIPVVDEESKVELNNLKLTFEDRHGTNQERAEIKTGASSRGIVTYSLVGTESVAANGLAFRLDFPHGVDVEASESTEFKLRFGSKTDPEGTPSSSDEYQYVWLVDKQAMGIGDTRNIAFTLYPFNTGQTGNGEVIDVAVSAYELKDSKALEINRKATGTMVSYADRFAFNNVSSSYSGGNQNVTTKTSNQLSAISFNQSVSLATGAKDEGLVHTSKIIYTNTFSVDKTASGEPYIKFTRDDIVKPDGSPFSNAELNVTTRGAYVTGFTIITEATAPAGAQISNTNAGFKINNAVLDTSLFTLAINAYQTVSIVNETSTAKAYPVKPVAGLSSGYLDLVVNTVPKANATYTNASETGNESDNQSFQKRLISLANVSTIGTNMENLAAYKNDIVVFDVGQSWENKQEEMISELLITEYANHEDYGYNSNEMIPLRINSGVARIRNKDISTSSVTLDVVITYEDGTRDTQSFANEALTSSTRILIPTAKQDKVSKIEFKYRNVEPGFMISTAPSVEYRVIGGDVTKQGIKIQNTARLQYSYNYKNFDKTSNTAYFRYRDVEVDKQGLFKNNKEGQNLTRNTFQEADDVILFNIEIENRTNDPVSVKTLKDKFTYNLSAYNGIHTVKSDPNSKTIDEKYLAQDDSNNPLNELNLVVWELVEDTENPEGGFVLTPVEDQSIIEDIDITESTGSEYSEMIVTFANEGFEIEVGKKLVLTYTMYTNDRFEPEASIGNIYEAFSATSELVGKGQYWKVKPNDRETDPTLSPSYNKSGINVMGSSLNERPYVDDVIIYTLTFDNKVGEDWSNIIITDSYSSNLSPYDSKDNIPDELYDRYGLIEGNVMNFGVNKKSDGSLNMPEDFDPSLITVTLNEADRTFTIDLGTNVLLQDEVLQLSYTMILNETADPSDTILNTFVVEANQEEMSRGRHVWSANPNATAGGIVSTIKSVDGIEKDGRKPDTSRLVDGEELRYKVSLSNYLPRPNRVVHVKNVIDYMPDYITYKQDSFNLEYETAVLQPDGTYEKITEVIDPDTYVMRYLEEENRIEVRFNDNFAQEGGVYGNNGELPINSIIMTYDGIVNSMDDKFEPIKPGESRKAVSNVAVAFYEETKAQLVAKSGTIHAKTENDKYKDGDDETNSYIYSSTSVQVLNENDPFGYISMAVTDNNNVDVLQDDLTRDYEIYAYNTAYKNFTVTHIVDLLPKYETVNEDAPVVVVDNTTNEEYEAVYTVDTVEISGLEYNRIIVTGYIKDGVEVKMDMEAIKLPGESTSKTVRFQSKVDSKEARKDLYISDTYTKNLRNSAAMYTDEPITLFKPQYVNVLAASKADNDHIEETDWDSNPTTMTRYETGQSVSMFVSSVAPYMDVRAQVIIETNTGTEYRDAKSTDFINPGDILGWKIKVGNSSLANTPTIKAGTTLVVELPYGLTFEGYARGQKPDFVDEVTVDGNVLIWKTNEDIDSGDRYEFTIRTTTLRAYYEVYTVNSYFVPYDVAEYGFFNSKIRASQEYRSYDLTARRRHFQYEPEYAELPGEYGLGDGNHHYVTSNESVSVLGNLSLGSRLELESTVNSSKKATTVNAPYFITLDDVEDPVRYSMYLDLYKLGTGVEDVVFINRLAGVDDHFVIRKQERRSNGALKLVDDGSFTVDIVNASTGSHIETVDESLYTIQYAIEAYDYEFTYLDWELDNTDIWMTKDELLAAGYTFDDVTATRTIIDNQVELEMNQSIKVTYLATLENYHNSTWQAYTSFAYAALVDGNIPIESETRALGLKSSVYTDRLKLTTEVIDPALTPLRTDFDIEIIAYDKVSQEEVDRIIKTVTVSDTTEGVLENVSWIEELSRNHSFDIKATNYNGFRTPTVSMTSETDQNGLTTWEAHIEYERIVYDELEVNVEVITLNDKYPLSTVEYTLNTVNDQNDIISEEVRTLALNANQGQDLIIDRETGNTYQVIPTEVAQYKTLVEVVSEEELDTTGMKYTYKVTYTQLKEDEVIDDKDKENGKKDPNTGIEDKTLVYVGILVVALVGVILVSKKSKKKDEQ